MKPMMSLFCGSALMFSVGSVLAGNHHAASKPVAKTIEKTAVEKKADIKAEKKAPSFLFVVSAKKALLSYKNGKHTLTIKKADLDKVIEFSDRPYRIVERISSADLQALWIDGKNSFEKDPPNAVLSGANTKPSIVILTGMESADDSIKYHLSLSHSATTEANIVRAPRRLDNLALTIDTYDPIMSQYEYRDMLLDKLKIEDKIEGIRQRLS